MVLDQLQSAIENIRQKLCIDSKKRMLVFFFKKKKRSDETKGEKSSAKKIGRNTMMRRWAI